METNISQGYYYTDIITRVLLHDRMTHTAYDPTIGETKLADHQTYSL
jgi:hypothetical protein